MNDLITANRKTDRAETSVCAELNKVNTSALALSATAIACWSTVALFTGTMNVGGPLNLLSSLLSTIAG